MKRLVHGNPRSALLSVLAILWLASGAQADFDEGKIGKGLNFFSKDQEVQMGQQYSDELGKKLELINDPYISSYVNMIGQKLAANSLRPDFKYQFFVVNTPEINAFALPGGFIYVNRGLIEKADNESELAGVIGHEIGHVVGRHSTKQMSKQLLLTGIVMGAGTAIGAKSEKWGGIVNALGGIGAYFAQLKFSRNDEREADWLGLNDLVRAGYKPDGMVSFFQKLEGLSKGQPGGLAFMSTHPLPQERINNMQALIASLPAPGASSVQSSQSFLACKSKLANMPPAPTSQEKTLSNALAALDAPRQASGSGAAGTINAAPVHAKRGTFQVRVPANVDIVDTGLDLVQNQTVEVVANGKVIWRRGSSEYCTPDGTPGTNKGFWKKIPNTNTGALIGRIGENYDYFPIGAKRTFRVLVSGRLYLAVNDDTNRDTQGGYAGTIRLE